MLEPAAVPTGDRHRLSDIEVAMKEILRSSSHGEVEVLKAELQAHGIDAVIRGDLTLGIVASGLFVCVADADEQRAIEIMNALEGGN